MVQLEKYQTFLKNVQENKQDLVEELKKEQEKNTEQIKTYEEQLKEHKKALELLKAGHMSLPLVDYVLKEEKNMSETVNFCQHYLSEDYLKMSKENHQHFQKAIISLVFFLASATTMIPSIEIALTNFLSQYIPEIIHQNFPILCVFFFTGNAYFIFHELRKTDQNEDALKAIKEITKAYPELKISKNKDQN